MTLSFSFTRNIFVPIKNEHVDRKVVKLGVFCLLEIYEINYCQFREIITSSGLCH